MGVIVAVVALARGASAAPDGWITAKTKIALMAADDLDAGDINVDTNEGRVVLHGKVRSETEKAAAERVAKKVEGVSRVQNLLQVVPKPDREVVQAADDDIRKQLDKALDDDASLDDSAIKVKSVNKGVVLLSGTSETLSDHLRALELARSTPGVRQVRTEVKSGNELAEAEVWRDERSAEVGATGQTGATGTTGTTGTSGTMETADKGKVSASARDMKLTAATKLRLLANDQLPATDINVDTHNATVTLFGMVPTEEAKKMAEQEARNVKGVTSVDNELQVVPSARKEFVQAKDEDVERSVEKMLDKSRDLGDVEAEVKDGVVRLTGSVPSAWHELEAARLTRSQKGVRAVHSAIEVKQPEDSRGG
jgi:hyperosmotically inducible protein